MQSSQDLNSNLIKSLTSVHLPPPPSAHPQQHNPYPQQQSQPQPPQQYIQGTRYGQWTPHNKAYYRRHSDQDQGQHRRVSEQQQSQPQYYNYPIGSSPQAQLQQLTTPVHSSLPASSPPPVTQLDPKVFDPVALQIPHSHPQTGPFEVYATDRPIYEGKMLEPETHIVPGQLLQPRKSVKRKSNSTDEVSLPLSTPPHTISRSDNGARVIKKSKIQETPTLTQARTKKTLKNPLSPRYSSPQADVDSNVASMSSSSDVSKPPQPSFTAPKQSKKQQREQKKQKQEEEQFFVLPPPHKMPRIIYDSDTKPPYSYATLIGMAILRGDGRKLTLSQIYSWISLTFKYYRKNDVGWQNSIRHNLSLNKAFLKAEKSPDGKGHYWEVAKGHEMQFVKGKIGKKVFGSVDKKSTSSTSSDNETASDTIESQEEEEEKPEPIKRVELDAGDMTSEDEFSDEDILMDDTTKTPKSQITSVELERPSLKKSHTAIGLQRFALPRESTNEDDEHKIPTKKQQLRSVSTGNGSLKNIPSLEAPETNWAASALGERIIFGQVRPDSESPAARMSNFPLTSSFSCNTNFELSPLKRQETGPLLEPLTPSSRIPSFTTTTTLSSLALPSTQQSVQQYYHHKTPLRNASGSHQNVINALSGPSSVINFLKTPTTKTRTPTANTNSILRKYWNSPAFFDDFYTSPSIPRQNESALFGSPEKRERRLFMEHTGAYGYNDVFGVDICSVVKRAVESVSERKKQEDDGSETDEDPDEK